MLASLSVQSSLTASNSSSASTSSASAALILAAVESALSVAAVGSEGGAAAPQPLPSDVGGSVLATLSNLVLAGAGGASAASSATALTAGVSATAAAATTAVLSQLCATALQLASAAPGAPVAFSSLPPAAAAEAAAAGSYCGAALAVTAARLPSAASGSFFLPLAAPLPPCAGASNSAAGAQPVTLPASVVAAAPPPSVALSDALLLELAQNPLYAGASLSVVQWGVSPVPLTAGTRLLPYKAPVKPGTLAAQADAVAAAAGAGAGAGRRALGVLSTLALYLQGALTSADSLSPTGATVSANTLLRAIAPRPTVAYDLLGARPMDSRVVTVGLQGSGSAQQQLPSPALGNPFYITLPILDLSIVRYNPASPGNTTIDVGNSAIRSPSLRVTCPTSAAAAARSQGAITAVYLSPPALAGTRAQVALLSVNSVAFSEVVRQQQGAGAVSASDVSFGAAALSAGGGSGSGLGDALATAPAAGAAADSTSASTSSAAAAATSFALSTDCGPPFGSLTFLCGPGTAGSTITFACPTAVTVPACLHYNASAAAWGSGTCSVVQATATAVTCACTQLGAYALRFPALQLNDNDLYAAEAPVTVVTPPPLPLLLVGVCSALLAGAVVGGCCARRAEARFRAAYAAALAKDAEVAWLARAIEGSGKEWVLDAGGAGALGSKVAPLAADGELQQQQQQQQQEQQLHSSALVAALAGGRGGVRGSRGAPATPSARALALLLGYPVEPLHATLQWQALPALDELRAQGGCPPVPQQLAPLLGALLRDSQRSSSTCSATCCSYSSAQSALTLSLLRARLCSPARLAPAFLSLLPHTLSHDASAPLQSLAFFAWAAWCLYTCAGLYVYCFGAAGSRRLPELSAAQLAALACLSAACFPLISAAAQAAAACGGRLAWRMRYPALAAELARRRAAAGVLGSAPAQTLLEAVAAQGTVVVSSGSSDSGLQQQQQPSKWVALPRSPPQQLLAALEAPQPTLPLHLQSPAAALLRELRARGSSTASAGSAAAFDSPTFAPPSLKHIALFGAAKVAPAPDSPPPAATAAPSPTRLAAAAVLGGGASAQRAQEQWEEEVGWVAPTPQCTRHCGSCLRAAGAPDAADRAEAFSEWVRAGGRVPAPAAAEEAEAESVAGGAALAEELRGGWEQATADPQRGSCASSTALLLLHCALWLALLLPLYFLAAFGLLRSDATAATLLRLCALSVALYLALLSPALLAAEAHWQLRLWPALARALAPLPWLGRVSGARAWVQRVILGSAALPVEAVLAGRLRLVLGAAAPAAAARVPLAAYLAEHAPLLEVGEALHCRAWGRQLLAQAHGGSGAQGAAPEAGEVRQCLLLAAVALAAGRGGHPPAPAVLAAQLEASAAANDERRGASAAAAAAAAASTVAAGDDTAVKALKEWTATADDPVRFPTAPQEAVSPTPAPAPASAPTPVLAPAVGAAPSPAAVSPAGGGSSSSSGGTLPQLPLSTAKKVSRKLAVWGGAAVFISVAARARRSGLRRGPLE